MYLFRQRTRAKKLMHPQLVAPVEQKIETEMETWTENSRESEDEADSSLSEDNEPMFESTNSFTVSVSKYYNPVQFPACS